MDMGHLKAFGVWEWLDGLENWHMDEINSPTSGQNPKIVTSSLKSFIVHVIFLQKLSGLMIQADLIYANSSA